MIVARVASGQARAEQEQMGSSGHSSRVFGFDGLRHSISPVLARSCPMIRTAIFLLRGVHGVLALLPGCLCGMVNERCQHSSIVVVVVRRG